MILIALNANEDFFSSTQNAISSNCFFLKMIFPQNAFSSKCFFLKMLYPQNAIAAKCYYLKILSPLFSDIDINLTFSFALNFGSLCPDNDESNPKNRL